MNKFVLGIDTSCDETSAAVIKDGGFVCSNIISSQMSLHAPHGGVVPEIASRAHAENIQAVIQSALDQAQINDLNLTGVAVTRTPGLIGCLLTGLSYAKALAYRLAIPITGVHHIKAHLFSPFIGQEVSYPFLGLVVSGGHTALYKVNSFDDIECIGKTVDDAAGEAYDKLAKLLGLGYPGGPKIDQLATQGNPNSHKWTRARVKLSKYHFSFSGLKTQVGQYVQKHSSNRERPNFICDLAASFQEEVTEVLLEKIRWAVEEFGITCIAVSGGVAQNRTLREKLKNLANEVRVEIAQPQYCADNGAMVAWVGAHQLKQGQYLDLDANALASGVSVHT